MEELRSEFVKRVYLAAMKNTENVNAVSQNEPNNLPEVVLFSGATIDDIKNGYTNFLQIIEKENKSIEQGYL